MTARRLAWSLCGLCVALAAAAAVLRAIQGDLAEFGILLPAVAFAGVGALLGDRRPGNAVGWSLLAAAAAFTLAGAASAYAEAGDGPRSVPAGEAALWLGEWLVFVWLGLVGIALPLLFPTGRLPSRRWRPLAWLGGGLAALGALGTAFGSSTFDPDVGPPVENPYALPGAAGEGLEAIVGAGTLLFAIAVVGALWAVVGRLRRARGVERQQTKWFACAAAVMLAGLAIAAVSAAAGERGALGIVGAVGWTMFLGGLLIALPVAIAVAILRHRLYDIDLVINRALVYSALTAVLASAYLGLVLLLGLALGPLTSESDLAIALSTLAVAALFQPVRRRVQALVDRRFYRRKYDAARTLERFGALLRAEVDLDALRVELTRVIHETMQPAHVSLWLRKGAG
jgi:hypothetical protein